MMTSNGSVVPMKKLVLALGDCAVIATALVGASVLRLGWHAGLQYVQDRSLDMAVVLVLFPLAFYVCGLYDTQRLRAPHSAAIPAGFAITTALLLYGAYGWSTASHSVGRGIVLEFAIGVLAGIVALRFAYAKTRRIMSSRCLVVGGDQEAAKVKVLVGRYPDAGLDVLGLVLLEDSSPRSTAEHAGREQSAKCPVLGTVASLPDLVSSLRIDQLILPASLRACPDLLRRLRPLRYRGVQLVDVVSLHEELAREVPLDQIDDEWLFRAATMNSRIHIRRIKRASDVVATTLLLVPGLLIITLAALAVKLTSRGPALFRQERAGLGSKPFTVLKLRTMYQDAEKTTGPVWCDEDDPRITPVGRFLRKFRIDELPQLFNVLRGDMSLVGPRPERPVFVEKLCKAVPFYSERLLVRPGITGWAQVMAPYAATVADSRRKLQFDLYYAKHLSLSLDLLILLMTAKTVLFGRERAQGGMRAGEQQVATIPVPTRFVAEAMVSATALEAANARAAQEPEHTEIAQA